MKDQPWHLNQTWPVGRKWCRFTNASKNFAGLSPKILGAKKKFYYFFITSALDTAYLRKKNVASTNQNASVKSTLYPYTLTYFPWPMTQKRLGSVPSFRPTVSAAITLQPS